MSVIGTVTRSAGYDRHGEPLDEDVVGTIEGLIFGAQAVESVNTRGHVVSTEGLVGVPAASPLQLKMGDHLVVDDGTKYRVDGPRLWSHPHSLTGTPRRYTWTRIRALHN